MNDKHEVRAHRNPAHRGVDFYGFIGDAQRYEQVLLVPFGHDVWSEPFMRLEEPVAQQLFQDLWDAGFRPQHIGTAGHVEAMREHLMDLRKVLFKQMDIDQPTT